MCSGNWVCLLLLAANVANMAPFLSSAGNRIIYKCIKSIAKNNTLDLLLLAWLVAMAVIRQEIGDGE